MTAKASFGHRNAQTRPPRGIAVGPVALCVSGLAVAGLLAWAGAATWFILNRDEIATRALARESAMQVAYESRLAAMRAQIDRIASRQLINQDSVDERLDQIMGRQAQIESRQALVDDLVRHTAPEARAEAPPPARPAPVAPPPPPDKPMPAAEAPPPLRGLSRPAQGASLFGDALPGLFTTTTAALPQPAARRHLDEVERSLGSVEAAQVAAVEAVAGRARSELSRLKAVLAETGLKPAQLLQPETTGAVGGPFIPAEAGGGPFDSLLTGARGAIREAARFRKAVAGLPLGQPVPGEIDLTSGFGHRLDPFTRTPALHSGIDFRGETGTPVHATAAGTVIAAEWSGGYGRMVEIDHGNGITTRYGHMSLIAVSPGQTVRRGEMVGRVGATGRATGPHLHYETRIADEPTDPTRFLRAGARLRSEAGRG